MSGASVIGEGRSCRAHFVGASLLPPEQGRGSTVISGVGSPLPIVKKGKSRRFFPPGIPSGDLVYSQPFAPRGIASCFTKRISPNEGRQKLTKAVRRPWKVRSASRLKKKLDFFHFNRVHYPHHPCDCYHLAI